jgi:hypothetical protein
VTLCLQTSGCCMNPSRVESLRNMRIANNFTTVNENVGNKEGNYVALFETAKENFQIKQIFSFISIQPHKWCQRNFLKVKITSNHEHKEILKDKEKVKYYSPPQIHIPMNGATTGLR